MATSAVLLGIAFLACPWSGAADLPAAHPKALEAIMETISTRNVDSIVRRGTVGFYLAPLVNHCDGSYHKAVGPRLNELFEAMSQL